MSPKSLQMVIAAMKLRHLLLGRKVMTNVDSIFKSKDIILPTKVRLVKAMVFPEPGDTRPLICLILASGAARHLPAHLPDTRQLSRATPARSSA